MDEALKIIDMPTHAELQQPWREYWREVQSRPIKVFPLGDRPKSNNTRRCEECGATLTPGAHRYCSRKCFSAARRAMTRETKRCVVCGGEFERRPHEQRCNFLERQTCGHDCRKELSRRSANKRYGGVVEINLDGPAPDANILLIGPEKIELTESGLSRAGAEPDNDPDTLAHILKIRPVAVATVEMLAAAELLSIDELRTLFAAILQKMTEYRRSGNA